MWAGRGELSVARFFPWPRPDLREHILAQDIVVVSGGNTANLLAIWRVHGFDAILREAWEAGVVLTGASAGMICWFEASITDSFGPQLEGMRDGLGFLPGSACPHYDGEAARRPRYHELVAQGFPAGIAADDGVALHYVGSELRRCRDLPRRRQRLPRRARRRRAARGPLNRRLIPTDDRLNTRPL